MFQRLFGVRGKSVGEGLPEDTLVLQRQVQALRLDVAEREREIARLQADLGRTRVGADAAAQTQLAALMCDVATPAAQLLTQVYLLEQVGQDVSARDVLALAKRLLRALADHGLTVEGAVGDTVAFDPDRHAVLGPESAPRAGQPVIVRVPGIAYRGAILHKAGVEKKRSG